MQRVAVHPPPWHMGDGSGYYPRRTCPCWSLTALVKDADLPSALRRPLIKLNRFAESAGECGFPEPMSFGYSCRYVELKVSPTFARLTQSMSIPGETRHQSQMVQKKSSPSRPNVLIISAMPSQSFALLDAVETAWLIQWHPDQPPGKKIEAARSALGDFVTHPLISQLWWYWFRIEQQKPNDAARSYCRCPSRCRPRHLE